MNLIELKNGQRLPGKVTHETLNFEPVISSNQSRHYIPKMPPIQNPEF
jgi:hypothetical protein